jgi:glycerate kinase
MMHVLAALDKFRGTATAAELAGAVARAAAGHGSTSESVPIADGGEGLLDVFGDANRSTTVTDALGRPVRAEWWHGPDGTAVIETARSNGLQLVGGAARNDPVRAGTRGVGQLLAAALAERPRRLVIGVGGSATTDGGLGAIEVLDEHGLLGLFAATDVVVACDVRTRYTDAAAVFGPQKGADAAQVALLTDRLRRTAGRLSARFGVDPDALVGGGAAGGLAGGLGALGARLRSGVELVAEHVGLDAAISRADLVVTGEGRLDRTSLQGKVVGAVAGRARAARRAVLVVCGSREPGVIVEGADVVTLVETVGEHAAVDDTVAQVQAAVATRLAAGLA